MARKPSPWYREDREGWFVTLNGQRHFLGTHPEGAPTPKKSERTKLWNTPRVILDAFHKLVAEGPPEELPEPAEEEAGPGEDSVVAVLDDFLTWCQENREPITARRYAEFCQDFVRADAGRGRKVGELPALELTSKHVTLWLNTHAGWGPTTKRSAITALQRGFNWAVKNRGLARNPIRGMDKPEAKRRSDVITAEEFQTLLDFLADDPLAELLIVSYDCGARPFEVKDLEARHLQLDKSRAVIPAEEAKGRKHTRTIYFPTERSMEIVARMAAEHPSGPLFRNSRGNGWTALAVKCRFDGLQIEFGIKEMERLGVELDTSEESIERVMKTLKRTRKERISGKEVAKQDWELRKEARQKLIAGQAKKYARKFNHYAFRRTFITSKIIAGVDSHVVARLSGHQSTAMIDRHYSAVANDHEFMLREAMKQIEPKEAGTKDSGKDGEE